MSSIRTPTGMISFPSLFKATVPKGLVGVEPRFSVNLILGPAAQKTPEYLFLRKTVAETIDEKFGAGKSKDVEWLRRMKFKSPFRPTADRDYTGYDIEGGVFIAPWSKNKPGIVDANREDILVPSDVWSGQLARCTVHAFAYDQSGNKGVAFNLNNIQIVKADMPRLDGRKSAKDEFDDADEGSDAEKASTESPF